MRFAIHDAVDEAFIREWDELAARCGSRFSSRAAYALSWHWELGRGPLRVAACREGGDLVAVLPLHERRRAGVRVHRLLGHGLGTVGEVLAAHPDALAELVAGMHRGGAVLQLTHLPADSPLVAALDESGDWAYEFTGDDHCPVIELPEGSVASDLRGPQTLRRSASTRRKLAREGRGFEVEILRTPDDLERRWRDIARTASAANAANGLRRLDLCAPPHDQFTLRFLRTEAAHGNLLLWGAVFGGSWGAHLAALRTGDRAEMWFTHFDPAFRSVRPGHLLLETVSDRHDEVGVTHLDLLLGRSRYKSDWQTGEYPVGTLLAAPRRFRRRLRRVVAADRIAGILRGDRDRTGRGAGDGGGSP